MRRLALLFDLFVAFLFRRLYGFARLSVLASGFYTVLYGFCWPWLFVVSIWLQMDTDTDMDKEEFSTTRLQKKRCKRQRPKESSLSSMSVTSNKQFVRRGIF